MATTNTNEHPKKVVNIISLSRGSLYVYLSFSRFGPIQLVNQRQKAAVPLVLPTTAAAAVSV